MAKGLENPGLSKRRDEAPVLALPRPRRSAGFTPRDLDELNNRALVGGSATICSGEMGSWALLYDDNPWASWGLVRQGASILLWNCVTLADVGRFPTVRDAVAAVRPLVAAAGPNVICFAAAAAARRERPAMFGSPRVPTLAGQDGVGA